MSYMNYLNRYQKWVEKGSVGNLIDENISEHSSDHSEDDEDMDEDKPTKTDSPQQNANSTNNPAL